MARGLVFSLIVLAACSKKPSTIDGALNRAPDESYETSGTPAWRVLVWKCDDRNERTSMVQSCGEGLSGCGAWSIDRTLCPVDAAARDATRTSAEEEVEREVAQGKRVKHPMPGGYRWR